MTKARGEAEATEVYNGTLTGFVDRGIDAEYNRDIVRVRNTAVAVPLSAQSVRALAIEAWRRAEAMGLVEADARPLEPDVAALVKRLRDVGIARRPALRFDNVDAPSIEEAEGLLRLVIAALEASPVPRHEWPVLARVLEVEQLASLLGISVTSQRRYASGERETPDAVAARLHHLALIVGDLAGRTTRWESAAGSIANGPHSTASRRRHCSQANGILTIRAPGKCAASPNRSSRCPQPDRPHCLRKVISKI